MATLALVAERRDRRGRRIGRNWWREMNHDQFFWARAAWERQAEDATALYHTEMEEYRRDFPMPRFKDFLIANARSAQTETVA